ncbi:MAG: penicillin acylase family protein [Planctomycetota bacterium]
MKLFSGPRAGIFRVLLGGAGSVLAIPGAMSAQAPISAQQVPGTVTITYDDQGVPHVDGTTDRATYFGLGYAQARDRYFQMCLFRLAGQGRMSEFFGRHADDILLNAGTPDQTVAESGDDVYFQADKLARITGFRRHCDRLAFEMQSTHPTAFARMQAYAAGINRFRDDAIAAGAGLDPLFTTFGVPQDDWQVSDSMLVWTVQMLPFHQSMILEALLESRASSGTTPDQKLALIFGDRIIVNRTATIPSASEYDAAELAAAQAYKASHRMLHYVRSKSTTGGVYVPHFSNAIAVAGDKVHDPNGDPAAFLVGMPRIPVTAPGPLYEYYIRSSERSPESSGFEARGAGIAGSPNMLFGSNAGNGDPTHVSVGWTMTSAGQDISDLVELEITAGSGGAEYMLDGVSMPFVTFAETIKVRNGADVTVQYKESVWGPVVTELVRDKLPNNTKHYSVMHVPFFTAPTSNTSQVRPPDTFVACDAMIRASGLPAFQDVVRSSYTYPAAHMTMADSDGNIGYTSTGALPVRRPVWINTPDEATQRFAGILPLQGNDSSNQWQEYVDPAHRVRVIHAPGTHRGYLHNGNQASVGSWHPLKALYAAGGDVGERSLTLRRLMDVSLASPSGKISRAALEAFPADRGRVSAVLLADLLAYIGANGGNLSPDSVTFATEIYSWLTSGGELTGVTKGAILAALFSTSKPQLGTANTQSTGDPQLDAALANLAAIYGNRAAGGLNFLEEMHRGVRGAPAPHPYGSWTMDEQLVLEAWAERAVKAFRELDGDANGAEFRDIRAYYIDNVWKAGDAARVFRWKILGLRGRLPTPGASVFRFGVDPVSTLGSTLSHTTGASYNAFLALDGGDVTDRWNVLGIGQAEQDTRPEFDSQAALLAAAGYKPAPVTPLGTSASGQPSFTFTVP